MGKHRANHPGPRRVAAVAAHIGAPTSAGGPVHGGGRRATRARRASRRVLPSAPTAVGVIAILAAGAGGIIFGQGHLHGGGAKIALSARSSHAYTGTDAALVDLDARSRAISRDSQRLAETSAASADLKAAVESKAAQRSAQLASLAASAERRGSQIAKNLWVLPMLDYRITARFGAVGLWSSTHTGLDFAAPTGTPIRAVANGVITEARYDGAYGNKTVQRLADGTEIWYCHQDVMAVEPGDAVVRGNQIGTVGSTGNVTGPHLHLEVRPGGGDPVDPQPTLAYHGIAP